MLIETELQSTKHFAMLGDASAAMAFAILRRALSEVCR
jgi:hypothetical protein